MASQGLFVLNPALKSPLKWSQCPAVLWKSLPFNGEGSQTFRNNLCLSSLGTS